MVTHSVAVARQRQILVGYDGMYRARGLCSVSSFGEGLAVWVLLPRVDRGRRADRVRFGLIERTSLSSENAIGYFSFCSESL